MTTKRDGKTAMSVSSALKRAGAKGELLESDALSLKEALQKGNQLASQSLHYDAAKTYLLGLRTESFVPTVLSNRAQASINLEDYCCAFADAAASLTIRPRDRKTWRRYCRALKGMGGGFGPDVAEKALLDSLVWDHCDDDETSRRLAAAEETKEGGDAATAGDLKEEGNRLFKLNDFDGARKSYSKALFRQGETVREVLNEWSSRSLELGAYHDALASAAASLRIYPCDDDAVYRLSKSSMLLGEPDLASSVVELRNLRAAVGKVEPEDIRKLRTVAPDHSFLLKRGGLNDSANLMKMHPPLMSDWVGPVETYDAGSQKGRGLRATKDVDEREVVLVQRPLVLVEAEGTHRPMTSAISQRVEWDGLFARIVDNLHDGIESGPSLLPVEKFTVKLDSVPPLLPSRHEYLPVKNVPVLSPERAEGIARVNSHGARGPCGDDPRSKLKGAASSALYPAAAMINHSNEPNCRLMNVDDEIVLVATLRPVKKGEELTYMYGNENHVRRHHNIYS